MRIKKGVSPVIATVLLVGMVVVIAVILFFWFKGISQEAITKFDGENIAVTCSNVQFNADYSSGKLSISNIGNVPIYDFKLKIQKDGSYEIKDLKQDYSTDWPSNGLNQGQGAIITLPLGSDVKKITLVPVLVGNSESGKQTHICNENLAGFIIEI